MKDLFLHLRASLRFSDVLDVGIVAFIVYRVLLLIRGTRAMQMLVGLCIVGSAFYLSSILELFTTHWLFSCFFDYSILIVVILFQDDLRRALTQVGKNPFSIGTSIEVEQELVDDIVRATVRLAKERIGALIVIQRETGLKNFIDTGSRLDSRVKAELLYAIFIPSSPIHDGAVIINEGRIAAAGCFLPLSEDPNIGKKYGTRHRAALGLIEETDAIVILVSEESGEAHLLKSGKMTTNLTEEELRQSLFALLDLPRTHLNIPKGLLSWIQSTQPKGSTHEDS